tara:strand:+ start:4044 stop:4499 length:456 start_codon:yes stop_codon:yes gene_type:complete
MIKTIIRAMYLSFISIILISIILACWTSYAFFSQPSKSSEITNLIGHMYVSQKSVAIDIIDLSKILIKDANANISSDENNQSLQKEFLENLGDDSLLDNSSITEDNGGNPLGIVIEQSLSEISEETLPEINEGQFDTEEMDDLINGMEMNS